MVGVSGDHMQVGAVFLLLGIAWLLGKISIVNADVMTWLLTAVAVLGGLYLMFMQS